MIRRGPRTTRPIPARAGTRPRRGRRDRRCTATPQRAGRRRRAPSGTRGRRYLRRVNTARPELLDAIKERAPRAAILSDFDGTLSHIVDEPDAARPLDGVPGLLDELAERYAVVGVLSGRPVKFLEQFLPRTLVLSGLYGLEILRDGVRSDHPTGGSWREAIDDVATLARAARLDGLRVENKGLSLTLHYRGHPELEDDVRALAERQAARSGLEV